ncbi:hypothetical protein PAST3_06661 [Cutibacterium acnes HL201PA1]|nr:hypothetical protein PAST3_06661 [Cutibacterium acnes HL201PA1]
MKKDTGRPAVLRIQHIATAIATWRFHPISLTTSPHRRIEPCRNPTRRYQLPSTGGDPAIGLTGIAGIVGLGTVITTTVTATHKSRR